MVVAILQPSPPHSGGYALLKADMAAPFANAPIEPVSQGLYHNLVNIFFFFIFPSSIGQTLIKFRGI